MGPPTVTEVPGSKHIKNHAEAQQMVVVEETPEMVKKYTIVY